MTFGEKVRSCRQEKGLTQENLGERLGVSSQAVSKWENNESYPDAELLLPLANELDVSLDLLFGNARLTERDVLVAVADLVMREQSGDAGRPFELLRRIFWTVEAAMFGKFDPVPAGEGMSVIMDNRGFTEISCEPEAPFCAVFPEPEKGWGEAVGDGEAIRAVFVALGHPATTRAVLFLLRQRRGYLFEPTRLARELSIPSEELEGVTRDLETLGMVNGADVTINGEDKILYYYYPNERVLPLFLYAKYVQYNACFHYQADNRDQPLIRP